MENKTLKLRIESANNLTDLNNFFKMNVYAIISVPNSNNETAVTHTHYDSGTNPTWNYPVDFTVNQNHHSLNLMVVCKSPTAESIRMGTVCIALKDLFDNTSGDSFRQISYKVMTGFREEGNLNLSYKFEDKVQDPVTNTAATQNLDPQISQPAAAGSGHGIVAGSASVLPDPHTHPTPGYPLSGYPPSGYPQPGYPPSGYPPSGYPQPGYPPSGYPPSGYPQPGYPPSGYPPSGYPPQTYQWPYLPANFGNGIKAGFLGYGLGGDKLTNIANMIFGDSGSGSGSASAFPFD